MLEAMQYADNSFVTLTYDEVHMPRMPDGSGTLRKGDVQNFLKHLRWHYNNSFGRKLRMFYVGEYGDQSARPHYHLILFNYPTCRYGLSRYNKVVKNCCSVCDHIRDVWKKGQIQCGEVTAESAQYVAGYTIKKMTKADDIRLKGRVPEFAEPSRRPGLGVNAMWDVASVLMEFNLDQKETDVPSSLRHGKKELPLGRFLRRKLRSFIGKDEKAPPEVIEALKEALRPLQESAQANSDATGVKYGEEFRRLILEAGDQAVANMEARQRIFKKRGNI